MKEKLLSILILSVVVNGALFQGGLVVPVAGDPLSEQVATERPSQNTTQKFTIDIRSGSNTSRIKIRLIYPARTATEADAAQSGSFNPEWFTPSDRVERIFDNTSDQKDKLLSGSMSVSFEESLSGRTPSSPPHGWIILSYDTVWLGYIESGERVRVDHNYTDELGSDWWLEVVIPREWETKEIRGDPLVNPSGQTGTSYTWSINSNMSTPLIIIERPEETATPKDTGVSLDGFGFAVAIGTIVALLIIYQIGKGD